MTKRNCPTPGCGALVDGGHCPTHRRQHDRARGTRQERGYDAAHDRLRASWQRRLDAGEVVHCWRCKLRGVLTVIDPANWHLGHEDLDRSKYRGPECVPCNTATSGRIAPDA